MSAFWLKIYNRLSKLRAVWVPGVVILGLVIAARATGLLQTVEWYALDLFLRSQPKELPDARVVLVGIDEQDIQALGQYPPTDEQLTQMLSAIQRYQPRAIGMNLFRDLPIPPGTADLNTLLESSENIFAIEKVLDPPVSAPAAVPENRVGFTDILLDRDGRQRRLLLGTQTLSGFRFSLALLLAKYYLNEEGITLKNGIQDPTTMRFDSVEFPRLSRNFGGYISLETGTGNVQTILRYRASSAGFPLVSIQDIQNGTVSPDLIRDRIVLLGVTAPSVLDSVSTTATRSKLGPSRNLIYGLEWQAHAVSYILSAVLDGRPTVKTWGEFWEYVWIVGWGCLGIAIAATSRPPKSTILLVAAGVIIICSAGYVSLFWGWWIPFVPAALAFAAETILVGAIYQYDRFTQEKIAAQEQLVNILKHMNSELEARVDSRTAELQAMTVALNQAKESAERASHAKGLFLSRMSHELRTPLNSILGFSQAIASDHTVPEANRDRARAIDSSGEHLLRLINEILDLSKLESGKYAVRETSFELLHLCQTLQTLFQQKIEQKDLRFAIEIAPETPLTLVGDEQKIAQVLINLLANAIKFTPEGSILLNISGELLPQQQIVSMRFEVIDTGVGIASEELSKLFVPFEQTQSGLHANSGTGLGLSISKHFVELMKGHIEVSSTLGQGSTFIVSLDLACPEEAALSESLSLQESKHKDLSNGAVLGNETITQTLALMDQAWLQDLQEAASRLKSRQVQSLLAMMPEEAENVEKYLQNLAQNYDYTRLASLAATVMAQKDV